MFLPGQIWNCPYPKFPAVIKNTFPISSFDCKKRLIKRSLEIRGDEFRLYNDFAKSLLTRDLSILPVRVLNN
jgi:hypothetical protein